MGGFIVKWQTDTFWFLWDAAKRSLETSHNLVIQELGVRKNNGNVTFRLNRIGSLALVQGMKLRIRLMNVLVANKQVYNANTLSICPEQEEG